MITRAYKLINQAIFNKLSNKQTNFKGGWQEARGATIGKFQGHPTLNNSYFVENIKEELDFPGEWFFDATEGVFVLFAFVDDNSLLLLLLLLSL